MKAARLDAYSDRIDGVRIDEVPLPEPARGQVRVRMRYAPINPSDLNFVHGTYETALRRMIWNQGRDVTAAVHFDAAQTRACPQPPFTLGGEGVGVVETSGGGLLANRLRGKRVAVAAGPPLGTWAEATVVDATRCVVLPELVSDEQASMFFVNPLTAWILVNEVLRVQRGQWLAISAAGSALGKSVLRMAQRQGFRTLCVVRSEATRPELELLGADAVVVTAQQDLFAEVARLTAGQGVEAAIDCIGGQTGADLLRCLRADGRLVIYGTLGNAPLQIPGRDLMMPQAQLIGFLLPSWLAGQSLLTRLRIVRQVKRLMGEGVFETEIGARFPLDQIGAALAAATQAGRRGKVLLTF
jgi:NADPH:quinone reductase-like Zn-dependent oxidoreductase